MVDATERVISCSGRTATAVRDIEDFEDFDPEPNCMTCGGDGAVFGYDMEEPLEYGDDEILTCPNCRGSGLAKDQWYW